MKVFRRPMFRKGGEAMTGIMENISPRQNYAKKGNVYDEADAIITERMGPVQKGDPLTDFFINVWTIFSIKYFTWWNYEKHSCCS